MITKTDFIAEQLRKIAPSADWTMAGEDRALELARMFERVGVTDLWALKLVPGKMTVPGQMDYVNHGTGDAQETRYEWVPPYELEGYGFSYYGRNIGYLGTPDRADNLPIFEPNENGYLIAWSARGRGNVSYVVRPNATQTGIEIAPVWGTSSDAAEIRGAIMSAASFFVFTALPMAGISAGAAIGNAILPAALSATYPGLASILGNVALSTAFNGGDIKTAVKNAAVGAASGFAGSQAGGFVASVADSQVIGSLANVATRTLLSGGDLKQAVAIELAAQGIANMNSQNADASGFEFFAVGGQESTLPGFELSSDPLGTGFETVLTAGGFNPAAFNAWGYVPDLGPDFGFNAGEFSAGEFGYLQPLPSLTGEIFPVDLPGVVVGFGDEGYVQAIDADSSVWNPFASVDPVFSDTGNATSLVATTAPTNTAPPQSTTFAPSQIIQGVTAAAMAVISLIRAYRSLDQPAINTTARVVRPDGSVSAITNNGLVQTRRPDGTVSAIRPPVGVPQSTVDGNIIVNNGDGTYTVISPQGQAGTYRYSTGSATTPGAFEISPTMLAIGAGALFLLMKK